MTTTADVDLPDAQGDTPSRLSATVALLKQPWVTRAAIAAAGIALFFAYLAQARTDPANSDGAGQALQAWDLWHGNLLLHGWNLGDVSYYGTEIPEYALVEMVRGLNGDVMHVAAAFTYTLLVLLAGALAKGRATGREGACRALLAVVILLAPPLGTTTHLLLSAPDHLGTNVPVLAIWLLLDRAPRRWWLPVLITLLLAWAQASDTVVLLEAVIPLFVVCAVRVFRRTGPWSEQWFELSLGAGAIVSAGVATLALKLIRQIAGFTVGTPNAQFGTVSFLASHIWIKLQHALDVFGADFFGLKTQSALTPLVHLLAVGLVVWAVVHAARRFLIDDDLVVQVLMVGFVLLLTTFMFGTLFGAWEVAGLLPMGAVLVGRQFGGKMVTPRLTGLAAAMLIGAALLLVHNASQPRYIGPVQRLTSFLQAHHLHTGLGAYWEASAVTLDSGNRVQVRPGHMAGATFVLGGWESNSSWYDPRHNDANFMIVRTAQNTPGPNIINAYGKPKLIYRTGPYLIVVWNKNLLNGPVISPPPTSTNILAAGPAR